MINPHELQLRAIMLLYSSQLAGISPLPQSIFHNLAFYSNTLSRVFHIRALDGKILKLKSGPYYPDLQKQLDYLICAGLVKVIIDIDDNKKTSYIIDGELSETIITQYKNVDETDEFDFIHNVVLAFSELDNVEISLSNKIDATYADDSIGYGNVIDFDEWSNYNPTFNVIDFFENYNSGFHLTKTVKIKLYIRQLQHYLSLEKGNDNE
ncbi:MULTISPECIES: hypothetical protein [Salmonella]|uniref:Uncharacterized protein n=3 Tax=Salmonella enterica TaxID=28901 RepID=A0A757YVV2_SALER|nr:hypothetical protein [Salmonella enterica]EAA3224271.1 hypothetical protein [Salmonella enterica subsp. enterica serovar Newport]EAA7883141.1 hypothetical protein [Salmonella enterica subsp. enterica]EBV8521981.1 hypothetical protein [Salmonella enterica subsp. enterica serovar Larochelle]ECG1452931.1 hypothetical protein [Salmonella enterica subsp. enterica serovar Muenchen str. CFSAN000595]MCL9151600.1 hypothetical protein [Salmonella enterica subsp. enterica serovar Enteritidis]HAC64626